MVFSNAVNKPSLDLSFHGEMIKALEGVHIFVEDKFANLGIIRTGHRFKIVNHGKDTLKIDQIEPEKGCLVLDYDKSIPPGGKGTITATIDPAEIKLGTFRKKMKVISNAKNDKALSLGFHGQILAAALKPILKVKESTLNIGEIMAGSEEILTPIFNLKNQGDDDLIIESIKSDQGCSITQYDKVIQGNKRGMIIAQIDPHTLPIGIFEKKITIVTNAKNQSSKELKIKGEIVPDLRISRKYIRLKPNKQNKYKGTLQITSGRDDLKITEVLFKKEKTKSSVWQSAIAIYFDHKTARTASTNGDGQYSYFIDFSMDIIPAEALDGNIIIKTNHPKNESLKVKSTIELTEK